MTFKNDVLVAYYLMSCYLYYEKNSQVLTDKEFDWVCKTLYEKWDEIDHQHKKFIDKENLLAQTGYNNDYPTIVKIASKKWCREDFEKKEEVSMEDLFE